MKHLTQFTSRYQADGMTFGLAWNPIVTLGDGLTMKVTTSTRNIELGIQVIDNVGGRTYDTVWYTQFNSSYDIDLTAFALRARDSAEFADERFLSSELYVASRPTGPRCICISFNIYTSLDKDMPIGVMTFPFIVIYGSMACNEELIKPRTHLLPINYQCVNSYINSSLNADDFKFRYKWNNTETKEESFRMFGMLDTIYPLCYTMSDDINDNWKVAGTVLELSVDNCLNNMSEESTPISMGAGDYQFGAMIAKLPRGTKKDRYIIDTRDKGCFLRYFDRFGGVGQILLDIDTEDTSFSESDAYLPYNGRQQNKRDYNIISDYINGNNAKSKKSELRILKCSLTSAPIDIKDDIEDLLMSRSVVRLIETISEPSGDISYRYEKVDVKGSISVDNKKSLMNVSIDVYITNRLML